VLLVPLNSMMWMSCQMKIQLNEDFQILANRLVLDHHKTNDVLIQHNEQLEKLRLLSLNCKFVEEYFNTILFVLKNLFLPTLYNIQHYDISMKLHCLNR
jgi:hypothetical protein